MMARRSLWPDTPSSPLFLFRTAGSQGDVGWGQMAHSTATARVRPGSLVVQLAMPTGDSRQASTRTDVHFLGRQVERGHHVQRHGRVHVTSARAHHQPAARAGQQRRQQQCECQGRAQVGCGCVVLKHSSAPAAPLPPPAHPSNGVRPMLVSTLCPFLMAAMLLPLPARSSRQCHKPENLQRCPTGYASGPTVSTLTLTALRAVHTRTYHAA
jgi:hypothetical protein